LKSRTASRQVRVGLAADDSAAAACSVGTRLRSRESRPPRIQVLNTRRTPPPRVMARRRTRGPVPRGHVARVVFVHGPVRRSRPRRRTFPPGCDAPRAPRVQHSVGFRRTVVDSRSWEINRRRRSRRARAGSHRGVGPSGNSGSPPPTRGGVWRAPASSHLVGQCPARSGPSRTALTQTL